MATIALEIEDVLNHLLKTYKISEAELGRKINIPRATINRLTSGRTPDPRASTLQAIADYFDVSIDQLLGKQPLIENKESPTAPTLAGSIPVLTWNDLKLYEKNRSQLSTEAYTDQIKLEPSIQNGDFAVKVSGDSMWPHFQENTLLIIDSQKEPKNRDFVLAYIKNDEQTLFRQLIIDGKYKFLKAVNSIFPTIQIAGDDKILGVIVQTRNDYT